MQKYQHKVAFKGVLYHHEVDPIIEKPQCSKSDALMTGRDREDVDFTRSRVKNNTELTNLGN